MFVPLNTRLAAPELAYMLDDSGASVLVFGPEHADVVTRIAERPTLTQRIAVAGEYEQLLADAAAEPVDVAGGAGRHLHDHVHVGDDRATRRVRCSPTAT